MFKETCTELKTEAEGDNQLLFTR